jgi:hypothetical protein
MEELRPGLWTWTAPHPPEDTTRADYRAWLEPFLELPVELVLLTHGDPGGGDLLERA